MVPHKPRKPKFPFCHELGYDKNGHSKELMTKVEEILKGRALDELRDDLSGCTEKIDLAREKGDGCFDYSDEEGYNIEDFDCNHIYTELLMQDLNRGIHTYTDREAKEILDDAFIVGTARRICQIARNPRRKKEVMLHDAGRTVSQTVGLTKVEGQRLDQARHSYDYKLRQQWRILQKIEDVPGYLKPGDKARAINLAVWQAAKGYDIRPRETCLPGESNDDAKRRRLMKMIKGVPDNLKKRYGIKKNWVHALQQQLPIGEFCYEDDLEHSYSYTPHENHTARL